jgi:hydrogenase maturation factor
MKIDDKGSIKMEHGAGGEGMRDLLELVLSYFNFNFNGEKGNNRVTVEVEVPLEALDDSAVVDNMVFTTDSVLICRIRNRRRFSFRRF